jgi:hypothetical protein
MPFTKQIRNWIRSFSLDAALIATLALPALLLLATEIAHSQPVTSGEFVIRNVRIFDGTHVITQGYGKQETTC